MILWFLCRESSICKLNHKIILFNHGSNDFLINNKDRIAQMVLTPVVKIDLEETDDLPNTVRGKGGFGSTGKWL